MFRGISEEAQLDGFESTVGVELTIVDGGTEAGDEAMFDVEDNIM
jgi:hypothetical protein